jgi:hypothetical protein
LSLTLRKQIAQKLQEPLNQSGLWRPRRRALHTIWYNSALLLLLLLLLQAVLHGRCQQLQQWLRNRARCCCWIRLAEVK